MMELIKQFILIFSILYFTPFIISLFTGNRIGSVFIINFLLGWSIIGWVWALYWALTTDKANNIIINNNIDPYMQKNNTGYQKDPVETMKSEVRHQNMNHESNNEVISKHEMKIKKLLQLKEIMDLGIITDEEFKKQKVEILK